MPSDISAIATLAGLLRQGHRLQGLLRRSRAMVGCKSRARAGAAHFQGRDWGAVDADNSRRYAAEFVALAPNVILASACFWPNPHLWQSSYGFSFSL